MRKKPAGSFSGYVKVELVSRYPSRWGWSIYRDTGSGPVVASETPFFCAEDAWDAGRRELAAMEQGVAKAA